MKTTTKILTLMSFLILTSCSEIQNAEKPEQAISYEKAKKMQQEYINTRVNPTLEVFKSIGMDKKADVRDVTFDLEVVQQYINYVKKEAKKKGISNGLGLRIYLGAYKERDVTMFFMPTKKAEDKTGANKFFYFAPENEILEGVDGLNFGNGGKPPKDLN